VVDLIVFFLSGGELPVHIIEGSCCADEDAEYYAEWGGAEPGVDPCSGEEKQDDAECELESDAGVGHTGDLCGLRIFFSGVGRQEGLHPMVKFRLCEIFRKLGRSQNRRAAEDYPHL